MDPGPFLRGVAFPGARGVPYPRARPEDAGRLPLDTWARAKIPVGVRLEVLGEGDVTIAYRTVTDELGYRGDGAGRTFAVWRGGKLVDEEKAELGESEVTLRVSEGADRAVVYLPEGMKPEILAVEGDVQPAPRQPRCVVYGDSVAEGWIASAPALSWPAVAGREHGFDIVNMGYAGAARGEVPSAEHVAALDADVVVIAYGTNCWMRTAHSTGMVREGLMAFLDVVRLGHPSTPIVVTSPIVRPDAEDTANSLRATLVDIRHVIEEVARSRDDVTLVPGRTLVAEDLLPDAIHPGDDGHRALAAALGRLLVEAVS